MSKTTDISSINKVLLTRSGLKKLQEELQYLKETSRKEVAKRLAEAVSYGDLSENAEYDSAKNEQAFIEGRILELEEQIRLAEIIEESKMDTAIIQIGSTVSLVRKDDKMEKCEYTIVGSTEADPMMHKISNESPVGSSILGEKKGGIVEIKAPGGLFEYEILDVK